MEIRIDEPGHYPNQEIETIDSSAKVSIKDYRFELIIEDDEIYIKPKSGYSFVICNHQSGNMTLEIEEGK